MIAFATAISDRAAYERVALPGIERIAEPGAAILTRRGLTIRRAYDELMDEAAALPGLEALVLLHQDLELADEELAVRIRRAFADPRAGLLGALGGRLSKLHCWLTPDRVFGYVIGPGPVGRKNPRFSRGAHEVDAIDGALIVAAPWVVRGVRFGADPAGRFHGYDIEISRRVVARGGRVLCEDIPCRHRTELTDDYDEQRAAGVELARRWDPALRPREWAAAFRL